jgi:OOP family OmpA-OmpF porin
MRPIFVCPLVLICAMAAITPAVAQDPDDIEGGKDTPYFSRMLHFSINAMENREFDAYKFFDGKNEVSIEGKVYQTTYRLKDDAPATSMLQIRRNYANAIKAMGAKILFEGQHEEFEDTRAGSTIVTALLKKGNKEAWFEVWPSSDDIYTITVVERQEMKQEVTATDMLQALNTYGFIALDIHFDTGKSTVRPESQQILDQIVDLLKQNADLKLSIEGHTDNVGDPRNNKTLSAARAESVMAALAGAGISASRLSAVGYGQERPVAENRSEEGRAKNRRVELIKK